MKYTKNLNLNKPEEKDNYDIHALNENMDILDTVLKKIMQKQGIMPRKPLLKDMLIVLTILDDQLTKVHQIVKILKEAARLANLPSDKDKVKSCFLKEIAE